jgi:hypothetical protein
MPTSAEALAVALPLVVGAALIALATLVLRKGGKHLHGRLFGALYLLSGIKSVGDGLTAAYSRADGTLGFVADQMHASAPFFPDSLAWLRISNVCGLAMLPILFLFCSSFPAPAPWLRRSPWMAAIAFLPSAIVGVVVFTSHDDATLASVTLGFNVLASGLTALALAFLLRVRARSPDYIERQQASYVALGFLPSFAATWGITALIVGLSQGLLPFAPSMQAINVILRFVSPVLELVSAGCVGFAILKFNILGVDPKFRVGVKSAIVGFVFVLVFLVTQAFENIVLQGKLFAFAGEYGSFLLSGVTSVVLFKPIEKLSAKVSDKLLPKPGGDHRAIDRAAEVYHAQCTYVLRDGNVSERELAFLRNLQAQLGLAPEMARAIEEEVERLLKVDAPQTGSSAGGSAGQGPVTAAVVPTTPATAIPAATGDEPPRP